MYEAILVMTNVQLAIAVPTTNSLVTFTIHLALHILYIGLSI